MNLTAATAHNDRWHRSISQLRAPSINARELLPRTKATRSPRPCGAWTRWQLWVKRVALVTIEWKKSPET